MNITSDIKTRFDAFLVKKQIPAQRHNDYRKWLRYYLDFCQKYHHSVSKKESLAHFIKKLQDKNKTQEQRNREFRIWQAWIPAQKTTGMTSL